MENHDMLNFRRLACQILTSQFDKRLCPDQSVGIINTLSGQDEFGYCEINELPVDCKRLIMILESPHTDEFEGSPKPAKGGTGELLRKHILNVKGMSVYKTHYLVLMNAIQYQCSLGLPTKNVRDLVFTHVWNHGGKEDFRKRLGELIKNDDVVVNCCTKGSGKETLRSIVQTEIVSVVRESNKPITMLKRTHPSSWHSKNNIQFEW